MVLIEGEGAPSGHYLLDVKEARRSVARSHSNCRQRRFSSEAERVMLVQRRAQAHSPALLHAVVVGAASFVARELQPSKDRLHLDSCGGGMAQLCAAMVTMGEVAAWDALRGASRDGAASVARLRGFASGRAWRTEIGIASRRAARRSAQEWRAWRKFARHLSAAGLPARE